MKSSRSALIRAAEAGNARICAMFGGQGSNNLHCFDNLVELNQTYNSVLFELFHNAAETISQQVSLSNQYGFYQDWGFDLHKWLAHPHTAPNREHFALAPMSFPLNTILGLANYCIVCTELGVEPGVLRGSFSSVIGHSQGLFAAAAIAKADSWPSFHRACDMAIKISFWVGLESHMATPPSQISAKDIEDCVRHGENYPSPMLSISGLNESQVLASIETVNRTFNDMRNPVYLGLVNTRENFVVVGPPQSLRAVCLHLRTMKAPHDLDQSRIPFPVRKPEINCQFLPISAPFHSPYLDRVDDLVTKRLSAITLNGNDIGIPLYETHTGKNLQDWKSEDVLRPMIRAVTFELCDWRRTSRNLNVTTLLDFGPGQIGILTHDTTEGTGLRVIRVTDYSKPSSTDIGVRAEIFATSMPPTSSNWKDMFAPQLLSMPNGTTQLQTKMTRVFHAPPIMVAGMTPTTVSWDFVATVMRAGYHIEIAGGGYLSRVTFEAALRKLAVTIPAHRGITCNLLYAKPQTIAWQISMLRDLIRDGIAIDGITVGAGVPSHDVVKEYIETLGLKHISFKPGSIAAIEQVIEIAQRYPNFPVGLQWTGGRAGGHHSFEDFHQPILKSYGRIRKCANIILIAGGGFGDAENTLPYLCGEWAHVFDYPSMPFDGILLGSRMMVAKEAHTSIQAKQLIVEAKGVGDSEWHESYDKPVGGVVTVTSEMGQPIHMLATRSVMLWKEFDRRIFSIRDPTQRVEYLRNHREEIIRRLNKDYSRPWFAVTELGINVEIEDLSYLRVLQRLCELTYVHHQHRWIDMSYMNMIRDFFSIAQDRFGLRIEHEWSEPAQAIHAFSKSLGSDAERILHPLDTDLLLKLFHRSGQKPMPFIPSLDYRFETWFKKDSLWQSEDVEAVVGQDAQRVCIIHGPVAATYSKSLNESAKQILDSISGSYIQMLQSKGYSENLRDVQPKRGIVASLTDFGIQVTQTSSLRKYEFSRVLSFDGMSSLIDELAAQCGSWAESCLKNEWIISGDCRVANRIRAAFQPGPGDTIEVRLRNESMLQDITFYSGGLKGRQDVSTVLKMASDNGETVVVKVIPPASLCLEPPHVHFTLYVRYVNGYGQIYETESEHIEKVRSLYAHLWDIVRKDYMPNEGLNSEFSSEAVTIADKEVQDYVNVISRTAPSKLQTWNPHGSVPLDYCVVIAWKALLKPLMIPSLCLDLLKLLHRSIDISYAPSARPLQFGDVVRTVSHITALKTQPRGRLIEISATIRREDEPVVYIKSSFFVQGKTENIETQFEVVQEPQMVVEMQSELICALLASRKWLVFDGSLVDHIGASLVFSLTTHTVTDRKGNIAHLRISGTVSVAGSSNFSPQFGQVYFEEESCSTNPVMGFLNRYGVCRVKRQTLPNPGWVEDSSAHVRAPPQSASYAKVSHDTNPIHVSPVFARYAGLTNTVVHGMHTSAIVRRVVEWAVGDNDRSRFKRWCVNFEGMVRPNDILRVEFQHTAMVEGRMVLQVDAFNDKNGDKVIKAEAEIEQVRTGYVFCGQGSQEKGMGMSLYTRSMEVKAFWDRGDNFLKENYGTGPQAPYRSSGVLTTFITQDFPYFRLSATTLPN